MPPTPFLYHLLVLSCLSCTVAFAQTDAINQRAMQLFRTRQAGDISAEFVVQSLKQEKEPSLVCLATGMLIQKGMPSATDSARVILAAQTRPDCFHQILTQLSLSQPVDEIVDELLKDKTKKSNLAAAAFMATHSQLQVTNGVGAWQRGGPNRKRGPRQNRGVSSFDFTDTIKALLAEKDSETIELALLAAAYSAANVDDEVESLQIEKSPGVEGARLLYLASICPKIGLDRLI